MAEQSDQNNRFETWERLNLLTVDDVVWLNQLSFANCSMAVSPFFAKIPLTSPGNIPKRYDALLQQMSYFKLTDRREERSYTRWAKSEPTKYPPKRASPINLTDWHYSYKPSAF